MAAASFGLTMSDENIEKAAITLQAAYRGKQERVQVQQQRLATSTRWTETLTDLKMKQVMGHQSSAQGRNSISDRFQRAGFLASRLQDGEGVKAPAKDQDPTHVSAKVQEMLASKEEGDRDLSQSTFNLDFITKAKYKKRAIERRIQGRVGPDQKPPQALQEKQSKRLEEQHWLEMIDTKHRYGANLKWYHRIWHESGTEENFFRWLDFGEGKDLDLDECPRERLEREQIFYCSAEQRLNYLVVPNPATGKLHWAKNGEPVDTAPGRWQDSGDGSGIIPLNKEDNEEPQEEEVADDKSSHSSDSSIWTSFDSPSSSDDGMDSEEAERRRDDAHHYAHYMVDSEDKKGHKPHKFTTHGLMDRLLRKTVGKNTWIYVCDMQYNVFVGIKTTGTFQHSSFLSGGLVASAGLIRVRNGQITALSPLSGHYRSSMNHFKIFLNEMEKQGLNLDKVKVGKSEMMLWGLETYGNMSKKHKIRREKASNTVRRMAEKLHISHPNDENEEPAK